jgi:hypothetical protein
MKETKIQFDNSLDSEEMPVLYELDYSKAKKNRFAPILAEQEGYVKLSPEILKVFKNGDNVNKFLISIINNYPKSGKISRPV